MDMKNLHSKDILDALIQSASSLDIDADQRQRAIADLALLLEKHSPDHDSEKVYKEILSPALVDVSLEEGDKCRIVEALALRLLDEPKDGVTKALIWALGKADGPNCIPSISAILKRLLKGSGDDSETWQGIISIERLTYGASNLELQPMQRSLEDLRTLVARSGNSENQRIAHSFFSDLEERDVLQPPATK